MWTGEFRVMVITSHDDDSLCFSHIPILARKISHHGRFLVGLGGTYLSDYTLILSIKLMVANTSLHRS